MEKQQKRLPTNSVTVEFLTEGKMNEKGKKLLKMYLPTLFAS
jgi:hypothetical protein